MCITEDIPLTAATEFLKDYATATFAHTQLFRIILHELPPRKTAFSENMIGALRLLRLWVSAHFMRDFWRAKSESKTPVAMFRKLRCMLVGIFIAIIALSLSS